MSIIKKQIHGFWVVYEEDAKRGLEYLQCDLQRNEAKTLFDAARFKGSAEFEDDADRDWTLVYNRGDYTYTIVSRKTE